MKRPNAAGTVLQALDPLAQKMTELEQRALNGHAMSVVQLASQLAQAAREAARRGLELVLEQAARSEPTCAACACGAQAHSQGFEHTFFVTRLGRVDLERRRCTCEVCGRTEMPLDKAWSLPDGVFADDVREATERLVCRLGYAEGIEELERLWGVAPKSISTAQGWVVQDGQRAQQAVKQDAQQHWDRYVERQQAVAQGEQPQAQRQAGFGVVEADGVQVLTWKPGQESRRKPVQAAPTSVEPCSPSSSTPTLREMSEAELRHQPPSTLSQLQGSPMGPNGRSERVRGREVCVGLVYLGEHACELSKGHGVILERRYVVTLNDRESFWPALHAAAAAQGVLDRERLVWLSDGGSYFIDQSAELFQDQPLVPVLDIQHAKQHVWETGHELTSDKKAVPLWAAPRIEAIEAGNTEGLLIDLAEQRLLRKQPEPCKAIDALAGYVQRHEHMMHYPAYRQAGYPIASAAIESTNKRLVGRRCKQGGMIWSERGLEAMLALRAAVFNPGAWERLWSEARAA